jgi:hypothetical protein
MSEASIINLNSTTPAAPADTATVKWQGDDNTNPRNVSAYVETATATQAGSIVVQGTDHGGNGKDLRNTGIQGIPVTNDPPNINDVPYYDGTGADEYGRGGTIKWKAGGSALSTQVLVNGVSVSTDTTVFVNTSGNFFLVNGV